MKGKKILIRNDFLEGGGVEAVLYYLATHLAEKGYRVTIKTDKDEREAFARRYPYSIRYMFAEYEWKALKRFSPAWFFSRICWLAHKCWIIFQKWERFDIAIAIKEGPCMQEITQCRAEKKYGWIHVDYRFLHWTKGTFGSAEAEVDCMKQLDQVVCVSRSARDSVVQTIGDPGNLCVCYNPLDYMTILRRAEEPCMMQKPESKTLFITVGRLSQQKNYKLLLEVSRQLEGKYPFEVWIVGDGPQRSDLENYIREHGMTCVKLLGAQENPYSLIKQADWFISTAEWESYGLAMQEALILEVPVITASCPAVEEVIDCRFAKVVPNDPDSVRMGMEEILQNPRLRQQYHDSIRKEYDKEALWDGRLKNIRSLWEESK